MKSFGSLCLILSRKLVLEITLCAEFRQSGLRLIACLTHLRDGDTLYVHSMDRLCRNLGDLRKIFREMMHRGVVVRFHKEGLTLTSDTNPMSNLLLSMLGAVAEFERSLILERQRVRKH